MDDVQKKVLKELKSVNPPLCVMSTVTDEGKSESAVLAYVVNEDLSILLSTHSESRKWKNIKNNPAVSLVFGLTFGVVNIQYEGTARLIDEPEEIKECDEEYFTAHPELKQYRANDTGFIEITPQWVRLNDYTQTPPKVEELDLS